MFTLKTIVCGDISLRSEDAIQIARVGSPGFKNIIGRMKGHKSPDYADDIPGVYADADCTEELQKEELIVSERADSPDINNCIGIIITGSKSPTMPECHKYNGQLYEFIYKGDEAYITDAAGNTVEIIR